MDTAKRTERLETEVDADLLDAVRALARRQGRDVGSVVDEALSRIVANSPDLDVRPEVLAAHDDVMARYRVVFKKLAE